MTRTERQNLGIRRWVEVGCRATWQYATGFGKTRNAINAIKLFLKKNPNKVAKVVVPTDYLKLQWLSQLSKEGLFNSVSVEIVNTSVRTEEYIDLLILDEIHRFPSDTFQEIFTIKHPKLILGLTATFQRLDGKHEILNQYCPVCDTVTVQEAIENKWLSNYKEFKVSIVPDDIDVYRELNKTFLSTFSFFNNSFQLAMECVSGRKYRNKIVKEAHFIRYEYAKTLCTLDKRDPNYANVLKSINAEVTANAFTWNRALQARKAYILNHPIKLDITRKILDARQNSKAITFSATIAQAEKIKRGYVVHSGNTKKKNRLTLEEFSQLKTGVLCTAKSLDEGADIPGLNLGIVLCNTSSSTQKTQRVKY